MRRIGTPLYLTSPTRLHLGNSPLVKGHRFRPQETKEIKDIVVKSSPLTSFSERK